MQETTCCLNMNTYLMMQQKQANSVLYAEVVRLRKELSQYRAEKDALYGFVTELLADLEVRARSADRTAEYSHDEMCSLYHAAEANTLYLVAQRLRKDLKSFTASPPITKQKAASAGLLHILLMEEDGYTFR